MFKILILGSTGAGKTSIMKRYTQDLFNKTYRATIGADFMSKYLDLNLDFDLNKNDFQFLKSNTITLQIWDTAGQERFRSLGMSFYRGADACILVFDITNPNSFIDLDRWYQEFVEQCDSIKEEINDKNDKKVDFPFILIGSKSDLSDKRRISYGRALTWAEERGIKYFETSALTGSMIDDAFSSLVLDCIQKREKEKTEFAIKTLNLTEHKEGFSMDSLNNCCSQ